MDVKGIPIHWQDGRGIIYDCDKVKLIVRGKGTTSADHTHEQAEVLFLIDGEVVLTVGEKTENVKAPCRISLSPNIYHKLVALTDIKILEYRR